MMKVTLAQLNPTVGDIKGNIGRLRDVLGEYGSETDLIVFPELYITGYPPRDLLENPKFIYSTDNAIDEVVELSKDYNTGLLVGAPTKKEDALYNSALLIYRGEILFRQNKSLLPTYDIFDETRYFKKTEEINIVDFKGEKLGISICEDAWCGSDLCTPIKYGSNPIKSLAEMGATLLINISASPFIIGKDEMRYKLISRHAREYSLPFLYVNQVGGNDELIFDGASFCVDNEGKIIDILSSFNEEVKTVEVNSRGKIKFKPLDGFGSVFDALVLGVSDYLRKCGFKSAVVGLSGGVDSAVTCCIAVNALGKDNVLGVLMPSQYTSEESLNYSKKLSENLGIEYRIIPITDIYNSYIKILKKDLDLSCEVDLTQENIQARIRGNILMAVSNKQGHLVLSTGNKSEIAVGYCTLYGDMSGGLSVLSDVPKTMVYELAELINRGMKVIPQEIINRKPSAELRPNQCDQDTLPPYDLLDKILYLYVEEGIGQEEIVNKGFDKDTVNWIIEAVKKNEYKRHQAPPGLKVTSKAFGSGRRIPIAAKVEI
jgi:NAD+ synthase (glutamine-hydrolysing)